MRTSPIHLRPFADRGMEPAEPVEVSIEVAASAEAVWKAISAPGNLTDVHPFCARNDVESWPGRGSRDRIEYLAGFGYQREAVAWEEGKGYTLVVGPATGATALATWTIERSSEEACRFSIEVVPFVRGDVLPEARAAYLTDFVEGALPSYLDSVVRGVRHFVESGTPVERNQFGAHAVFSPDVV